MMKKGIFITFEGVEGCGKTTQVRLLTEWLIEQGYSVNVTREPGGTPIGEQIRSILVKTANTGMHPITEAFLLAASRNQHIAERIRPALDNGEIVLCDRFADASIAYQGYGRMLPLGTIQTLIQIATQGVRPDLTFLIDIDPEFSLNRARKRDKELDLAGREDRFEREELQFHHRVREGYLHINENEPDRIVLLDGTLPIAGIQESVREIFQKRFGSFRG